MNLTKDVIKRLEEKSAKVKPFIRTDGSLPDDCVFLYPQKGKGFVFERTNFEGKFSFILIEKSSTLNYSFCHARGFVYGRAEIVDLIFDWCEEEMEIEELVSKYSELEAFKPFLPKHKNEKIEKAWVKVKNKTFNDSGFSRRLNWLNLNDEIINAPDKWLNLKIIIHSPVMIACDLV